jgi:hypothetical protein
MFRFWKKKEKPVPLAPVAPQRFGFTLEYFRHRPDLVEETQKIYRTPWFQAWVSVLQHELPIESTIEAVRAHKRLIRIMEMMALPPEAENAEILATFGAEREFPELAQNETQ